MKVILLDNIRTLGRVGDIKEVHDGYARNFLLPRNLARPATPGSLKAVEQFKAKKLAVYELAQKEAAAVAEKLQGAVIELSAPANEQGTLFAAIEPSDIASKLSELAGARIEADSLVISDHIKSLGEHSVTVNLADDVSVDVTVRVSKN